MDVKNGQISRETLCYYHSKVKIKRSIYANNSEAKNIDRFELTICDGRESEDDSTIACKLPVLNSGTITCLFQKSPTISKASEKLIDTITVLGYLNIKVPITGPVQGVIDRLVQKKTLGRIVFDNDHQFDEGSTKLLLGLLKQEQFDAVGFPSGCTLPLNDLVAGWREHSDQMIGKRLAFKANLRRQLGSDFQARTKDELLFLKTYHQLEVYSGEAKYYVLRRYSKPSSFWKDLGTSFTKFLEKICMRPRYQADNQKSEMFGMGARNERAIYVRLCDTFVYKTFILFT